MAAVEHLAERAGRRDPGRGGRPAGRRARAARPGRSTCSPRRSPARCSSPRWRSGSPPAPIRSCATRSCRSRRGSAGRCTGSPSSCSAPTSAGPAYARRCRPPSTCCAGSAWPTCSPTTPPAAPPLLAPGSASSPTRSVTQGGTVVDSPTCSTDLDAESAELDAPGRRPAGRRLGAADAGARLDRRATRSPTWPGPTSVALLAATDPEAFYARLADRSPTTRTARRPGRREFLAPPGRAAAPLAGRPSRPGRRAGEPRRPARRCPGSAPDVAAVDGHRPAHGDLGARPRTSPTRSASTRAPTDRLRHVAHLGVRTLGHAFLAHGRTAPPTPVRVELAAPDGDDVDVRARRTRPTGSPARRWTSACWSPSAATAPTWPWSPPARSPTSGSTWPRRSPARPATVGSPRRPVVHDPDRQRLRLLRRPVHRLAGDARRRRPRRARPATTWPS